MDPTKEFERRKQLFKDYLNSEEYQKKLIQRLQINDACNKKTEAKVITWNLCARPDNPAEGATFFIENFGWTFDPRPQAPINHLPFILFDYQKDTIKWIIDHIDSGKDGLVEKSRDMGASWMLFVWVPIWYWLFRDGVNLLVGSYKEDLVDDRTKDSLFGMIDYAVDSLPKWLLPKGFKKDKHRNQMKLVNPVNLNLIAGDTMNPDFGRGTRKTAVLFDELGSWDYAKDAWESTGDVTACRIANSTPKGMTYYAKLRNSGIDVLTLLWKLHPLKDQMWYEFEKTRRTEEEVAQEIDISYTKSQEGRVYPEWNDQNIEQGNFEYDSNFPLYVGWDFGLCLSEDTQALTPTGWKFHSELTEGDLIYTLNTDSKLGEWQPIKGKLVMSESNLISVNARGFKSRFTVGHRWYTNNGFKTWEEISSIDFVPTGAELGSLPKEKKYTDSLVELVSWYWTEGYNNNGAIEIGQAKKENFDRIRLALKNEFGNPKENLFGVKEEGYVERPIKLRKNTKLPLIRWYINKVGAKKILDICLPGKIIKYDFINSLTKEQLELFVQVSLLADGRAGKLKQSVSERTEVFAYAAILLGKKISYGNEDFQKYGIYKSVQIYGGKPKIVPYNFKRRGKSTEESYDGLVWCPTIDNHVWLARSNDTVYFTGNTDDTAMIWSQPVNGKLRIIDTYRNAGKTIDFYIPLITGIVPSDTYHYTPKDMEIISEHKYWKRGTHFGDPAGRFQNQVTNTTVLDILRQNGIVINFQDAWKEFQKRKTAAKLLIRDGIQINKNERTEYFDMCMVQSTYPKVRIEGQQEVRSIKPIHNWASHYRSAFEYLALGLHEFKNKKYVPFDKFPKKEINRKKVFGY